MVPRASPAHPPLLPPALRPGDLVAVVATSGPVDGRRLDVGLRLLSSWGLRPLVMPHVGDRHGFLAGRDEDRLADLRAAWADPEVRGLVCARGGYGCQRIVDGLDLDLVRRRPKVLVGFSDVTALHLAVARAGLVSFHGPMAAWDRQRTGAASAKSLRRAIMDPSPLGPIAQPPQSAAVRTISPGAATGTLVGGNLSLLCASVGTPDQPDAAGRVLLLEDAGEPPYRVDRMLRHLLRAGVLPAAAGVAVGEFVGCDAPPGGRSLSLRRVLDDVLGPLGVPAAYGFALGHGPAQQTVPLGVRVRLDADAGRLTVLDPATTAGR